MLESNGKALAMDEYFIYDRLAQRMIPKDSVEGRYLLDKIKVWTEVVKVEEEVWF
jgi:hypothetical protein